MKNVFALCCCIAALSSYSQISPEFQYLNLSECSTGFFWGQTTIDSLPPDVSEFHYLKHSETRNFLDQLRIADITSAQFEIPNYSDIRSSLNLLEGQYTAVPIMIAEIDFQKVTQAALDDGSIYVGADDSLHQSPNATSILETKSALIVHLGAVGYNTSNLRFRLDPSSYLQNFGSMPNLIRMDFNDGEGWRTITPGQIVVVHYNSADTDRNIKVEVTRNGAIKKGGYQLKSMIDPCTYEPPVTPIPWPTDNSMDRPWQISTLLADGLTTICGNAYYLPNDPQNPVFDKPFIFVEGIDFNSQDHLAKRNGDFGWCEFTGGINDPAYSYSMIARMPQLLAPLREHGYDIILLDFCDGADYLENNGALLVHLIEIVNSSKVGNEPIVVAGASMGGQVSRYALDYMERNGIDHCARLWISLDSPHQGANIPIGLQQAIYALKEKPAASEFIDGSLKRPATQQMLNMQVTNESQTLGIECLINETTVHRGSANAQLRLLINPPLRDTWYQKMNDWGYPTHCRNVAICNGNITGSGLQADLGGNYSAYHPLLNYSCELTDALAGPEAKFWIAPSCGDPWFNSPYNWGASNTDHNISAQVASTEPRFSNHWHSNFVSALNALASKKLVLTYSVPTNTTSFDYAPGGFRNSVETYVGSINATNELHSGNCPSITNDNYNKFHSFISTASALGLSGLDPFENILMWLPDHPTEMHFDNWYGPTGANEPHTTISEGNLQFFKDEILGGENPDGSPLLPMNFTSSTNGGVFNFGKSNFTYLRGVHITSGGKVYVNKQIPLHFGTQASDNVPVTGSNFKLTTWAGCAASNILIDNNGRLEIGDPSGTSTAEFKMKSGSIMTVDAHGLLLVHPGSTIILESGSELVMGGGVLDLNGGEIIVKAGAKIRYLAGNIILSSGKLTFDGGKLQIANNVTCEFTHTAGQTGYVEILPGTDYMLLTGQGSKLKFSGQGPNDLILKINNQAHLQNGNFHMGEIVFFQCLTDLSDNGGIWTDMILTAAFAKFVATGGEGEIVAWNTTVKFLHCDYNNVAVKSNFSNTSMSHGHLTNGFFKVYGGGFSMIHSSMMQAYLESSDLQMVSAVNDCSFTNTMSDFMIYDASIVELKVTECSFQGDIYRIGLNKLGGKLSLKCSVIRDCGIGVLIEKGVVLNMSSSDNAGYNKFVNCKTMIHCDNALDLQLDRGYNDFSYPNSVIVAGALVDYVCTVDNETGGCVSPEIPARGNFWPNGLGVPDYPAINLQALDNGPCMAQGNAVCYILLYDNHPEENSSACGSKIPIVDFKKNAINTAYTSEPLLYKESQPADENSTVQFNNWNKDFSPGNPMINTSFFENVELEDALIIAASYLELTDTLGNDSIAIGLFYQILSSGLDRSLEEIRWKMNWGLRNMKTGLENMFVHDRITTAQNVETFHPIVQQYVDVLNIMTDDNVSDSTYVQRFYFELQKAHLYRTIGNGMMAYELFDKLDDCQLDSLEQSVLNKWLASALIELSVRDQYTSGMSQDSISFAVDTTGFSVPTTYLSNEYFFGATINSPNSVSYVPCAFPYKNKIQSNGVKSFNVYPNPSNGLLNIQYQGMDQYMDLVLTDVMGKVVYRNGKSLVNGELWTIQMHSPASGSYMLTLSGANGVEHRRVVFK